MNDVMVSVCVLSYNHERYLRQCLDGMFMQIVSFPIERPSEDHTLPRWPFALSCCFTASFSMSAITSRSRIKISFSDFIATAVFRLCLFDPLCSHFDAFPSVIQKPAYAAYGGSRSRSRLGDGLIGLSLDQAFPHVETLCQRIQFIDGTDVFKEQMTFVQIPQCKNGSEKLVDCFLVNGLFHKVIFPPE